MLNLLPSIIKRLSDLDGLQPGDDVIMPLMELRKLLCKTDDDRIRDLLIVKLKATGIHHREIGSIVGCSASTVSEVLKETGDE
jgi:hypothetical protein